MAKTTWATTAWVTGASSGIGRELALLLARSGTRVAASARSADTLALLAKMEPGIVPAPLDVTDASATAEAMRTIVAKIGNVDLAILNAGVWEPMSARDFSGARAAHTMSVNFQGMVNCLEAVLPGMLARGAGQIALVASVAGYRGLPRTMAYGPSKAAIINLAEALRLDLAPRRVKVSVINPGYVDTAMTRGSRAPMPFMVDADDAARRIVRGLARGKFEIVFPWQTALLMKLGRLLPNSAYFWYARTMLAPPRR